MKCRRHQSRRAALAIRHLLMALYIVVAVAMSSEAATVDGLKIHATVTGAGRTTVFLVHGYTCDDTTWTEQVPMLEKQFRVVTLDLPGHGRSDTPKVEQFSMGLFARAIEAVRVEVKAERIVLVGHSMGTPVIAMYAHLYPQRTAALVFVDGLMPQPTSPAGSAAPANGGPSMPGARMGGPNGRQSREAMIQRFFVPNTATAVRQKVLHMMLAAPEATAVGAMNASADPAGRTTEVPDVPILGLYADPPLASREAVLRSFPKATYTQIPDTGHFLMLEKPAEFNARLLQFLSGLR